MKRDAGAGTIFPWKRKDAKTGEVVKVGWTAMLDLGVVDGKRKRQAIYGKSQREVRDKLNEALRDHQRGVLPPDGRGTVGQWLTAWLRNIEGSVRPRTLEHYEWLVREHLVPSLGSQQLARLAPSEVEAMLGAKLKAGLSPRTVHHMRAVLRNALHRAERDGLVSRNVASLAAPPHVPKLEMRTLTPEQVEVFVAAIKGDRLESLYLTTLGLGLRQGEVLGLRWQDIDLEAGILCVTHALQWLGGKPMLVEPKSASSRRALRLHASVSNALREHRARQVEERLALGPRWLNEADLVFVGATGEPWEPTAVLRRFQVRLLAAGLPKLRFHDLRHSCASLLLLQHVPARMVQEILGHSNIGLTLGTYSHVLPSLREQATEAQGRILGLAATGDV